MTLMLFIKAIKNTRKIIDTKEIPFITIIFKVKKKKIQDTTYHLLINIKLKNKF